MRTSFCRVSLPPTSRRGEDCVRGVGVLARARGIRARLLRVGGTDREPDPSRWPELGRLASVAKEEGVEDLVTFVGRRDRTELVTYYNAADVFVSTPWY